MTKTKSTKSVPKKTVKVVVKPAKTPVKPTKTAKGFNEEKYEITRAKVFNLK